MATSIKNYIQDDEQDELSSQHQRIGDFKSFKILLDYTKGDRPLFSLSLFLILLSALIRIISAKFMGVMVEDGLLSEKFDYAIKISLVIIFFELLSSITLWKGRKILAKVSSVTLLKIRSSLFAHLQKLPISYFDRQPEGRIVTRLTHDVEGIEEFFTGSIGRLVDAFFISVFVIVAMSFESLYIAVVLITSILPAILFIQLTKEKVRRLHRKMSRMSSAVNSMLSEYLSGMSVIRFFGLEKWSKDNFNGAVSEYLKYTLDGNSYFAWTRPLISFFVALPLIGLIWFSGKEVIAGTMTIGLFVTFVRYCERFLQPVLTLAREIHVIQQAFTNCERVATFLSSPDESVYFNDHLYPMISSKNYLKGQIEFKNVYMSYESDQYILKGVNFLIEKGESVGLVGRTGCGKSTTISLLSRLYDFQIGKILIDDIDIRSISRDVLRKNIGLVSQDVIIFHGTLRDNLDFSKKISHTKLNDFAKKTGLFDVMEKLNLSYESVILEGGANLSTGERQLIALTRILVSDPSILILDEATSNIDPDYEKIIQDAITEIMKDRTCLIIAHRLQTLKDCDRIFEFEDGEIKSMKSAEEFFNTI